MYTVGPTRVSEVDHSGHHGLQEQPRWPRLTDPHCPSAQSPSQVSPQYVRRKVWGEDEVVIHIIRIKGPPRKD